MEQEPGHHSKVATAASNGPEEIGLMFRTYAQMPAIRRHYFRGQYRVDGHPELAHKKPDPATKGDATDADGSRVTETNHQPVLRQRLGDLVCRRSSLDPRPTTGRIDVDLRHLSEVEHNSAVCRAVADNAMAATSDRQLKPFAARGGNDSAHVVDIGDTSDR